MLNENLNGINVNGSINVNNIGSNNSNNLASNNTPNKGRGAQVKK